MGGTKCRRCGLRRFERDVRCYACGAPLGPAAETRRRAGGGTPRILLGTSAVLAVREQVAPPGLFFNIARCLLGVPCALVLALWAWVGLFLTFTVLGPMYFLYAAPPMIFPLISFYCCLRVLPARKVAALGLLAHLGWPVSAALSHYMLGQTAVGSVGESVFGWVVVVACAAAWVALYLGRLMDEGRLRANSKTQTALAVALILCMAVALAWARQHDRSGPDGELERVQRESLQRR